MFNRVAFAINNVVFISLELGEGWVGFWWSAAAVLGGAAVALLSAPLKGSF